MGSNTEPIIEEVRRLLNEEAHLIGQELQDSLCKAEAERLTDLSLVLDRLDEMLKAHRTMRPHPFVSTNG